MEAVSLFILLFVVSLASGHSETSEAEMSTDTESGKRAEQAESTQRHNSLHHRLIRGPQLWQQRGALVGSQ